MTYTRLTRHQRDRIGEFLEKVAIGTCLAGVAVTETAFWTRLQAIIWSAVLVSAAAWQDGPIKRRR